MTGPLDSLIPIYDARERFLVRVRAPAPLVYQTAAQFDVQSVALVQAIFWLRGRFLGSKPTQANPFSRGFLVGASSLGWGVLREEPGRLFVAGGYCQPWRPDVVFHPLTHASFQSFAEPNQVKIAWTLEVDPLAESRATLATETRAVATDADARHRFRTYWRWARFGIHSIRWLLLPAIRREAEARYQSFRAAV
jgi:hypothetical protein